MGGIVDRCEHRRARGRCSMFALTLRCGRQSLAFFLASVRKNRPGGLGGSDFFLCVPMRLSAIGHENYIKFSRIVSFSTKARAVESRGGGLCFAVLV